MPTIGLYELHSIPVKQIDLKSEYGMHIHSIVNSLVDQLLQLNKDKQSASLQSKLDQIQSKIDYCEDKINKIVYELYGLTEEEIKIVEGE
jgi:protoheme ferro-lyase